MLRRRVLQPVEYFWLTTSRRRSGDFVPCDLSFKDRFGHLEQCLFFEKRLNVSVTFALHTSALVYGVVHLSFISRAQFILLIARAPTARLRMLRQFYFFSSTWIFFLSRICALYIRLEKRLEICLRVLFTGFVTYLRRFHIRRTRKCPSWSILSFNIKIEIHYSMYTSSNKLKQNFVSLC